MQSLIPHPRMKDISYVPKSVCKVCLSTIQCDSSNCTHKGPGITNKEWRYKCWTCKETGVFFGFCTRCDYHDKGKEWIRNNFKVEHEYWNLKRIRSELGEKLKINVKPRCRKMKRLKKLDQKLTKIKEMNKELIET